MDSAGGEGHKGEYPDDAIEEGIFGNVPADDTLSSVHNVSPLKKNNSFRGMR